MGPEMIWPSLSTILNYYCAFNKTSEILSVTFHEEIKMSLCCHLS